MRKAQIPPTWMSFFKSMMELLDEWLDFQNMGEFTLQAAEILLHSGSWEALTWLLDNAQPRMISVTRHERICIEAAKAGLVWVLERLTRLQGVGICSHPGHCLAFQRMINTGNAASIAWLHHECPACFNVKRCRLAAEQGNLALLQILRGLQPPCPWDSTVSRAALSGSNPEVLNWMLNAVPPCPINFFDACARPLKVIASGHLPLLDDIWPVELSPQQVYEKVARHGHMHMLQWLLDEQLEEAPKERVAYLAAKHGHLGMLKLLLARQPDISIANLTGIEGQCLVFLAKTRGPVAALSAHHKQRVPAVLGPWLTMKGLLQWSRQLQSTLEPRSLATIAAQSSNGRFAPEGGNLLLAMMAHLPKELADKIIDQAVGCGIDLS